MGNRCMEGATAVCLPDASRDFGGAVTPNIRRFEDSVLARHFAGAKLDDWERDDAYHSYYNATAMANGTSIERVWHEYMHWPAPTIGGRRDAPVREGDTSLAMAAPRGAHGFRVPLPGGMVTHYLDAGSHALINATQFMHVLHPGYIVRWLSSWGPVIVSNTLGRGVGITPRMNEFYGVRIFHELDQRIKARL